MSYDTSIDRAACEHCGRPADSIDLGNMTSNVGVMYYRAMPGPFPGGGRYAGTGAPDPSRGGLTGLSGLAGAAAAEHLRAGLAFMREHEAEMRALEPANRWGSYEHAIQYLETILAGCESSPDGILAVSW